LHVNIATVKEMNSLLSEKLGSGHVLKISELIEGKPHNSTSSEKANNRFLILIDDGTVTLTKEDIALLSEQEALAAMKGTSSSKDKKSQLIVNDNTSSLHALQVNTPIGLDVWKDIDIIVERNTAATGAIQFNAPMTTEAFLATLNGREKE